MNLLRPLIGSLALLAISTGTLFAQDKDKLKREVMEEVEKMLRAREERILKSIDDLLREEFAKLKGGKAPAKGKRGYLGIRPSALSADELEELELDGGARIAEILPGTPAEKSGLEVEDIILAVDGETIEDVQDLVSKIGNRPAGSKMTFTILREDDEDDIIITLGVHPDDAGIEEPAPQKKEQDPSADKNEDLKKRIKKFIEKEAPKKKEQPPEQPGGIEEFLKKIQEQGGAEMADLIEQFKQMIESMGDQVPGMEQMWEMFKQMFQGEQAPPKKAPKAKGRPYLGVLVEELSPEEAKKAGIEPGEGLLVSTVREGSSAEKAGVKTGDILVGLNGKKVQGEDTIREFMMAAAVGDAVEIAVIRDGGRKTLKATLEARRSK